MFCPKCNQTFDEGSRRFCPTDGARVVSDVGSGVREGGIFANLIPKIDGLRDLDKTRSPQFLVPEPIQSPVASDDVDSGGAFFEIDDIGPDPVEPDFLKPAAPVEQSFSGPKPVTRKVNPYEIPAGHVDLGDADRLQGLAADFDENDPESFTSQIVKGRYNIIEFLGGDETGLAYLADDRIVEDRKVLVRVLLDGETDEIMDTILAEERVSLSHFSHPNIARLIDSGQFTTGAHFLVSEYVDALSVSDILSIHGPFNALRAARIIRQAANALNEAHQEGILHRDLRPENLIIDASVGETEQIKLVNFGASNGAPTPRNFAYKAHEVLDGRIATVSSDIFSLGVVAFEMVTGRMPFNGGSTKEIVRSQNAGMARRAASISLELPQGVNDVFAKAFSFNSADRFSKARDFGDAFYAALSESKPTASVHETISTPPLPARETLIPIVPVPVPEILASDEKTAPPPASLVDQPAWKSRSPEPPQEETAGTRTFAVIGAIALVAIIAAGWYYFVNNPAQPLLPTDETTIQTPAEQPSPAAVRIEMPPQPRNIPQPVNTNFYQNTKQNLKGDLLRNFVGFTMYYPNDWKVNGAQESAAPNTRGKFLDISRLAADERLKEQMLISYYPSRGTYSEDAAKFPQMVKETNDTLKKLLPGYQMVSEGEIKFNGEWRAYEVKFQAGGESEAGEKIVVWGRRLFIPAARPGVRNGFEITMLATSAAEAVRSVDDVGVRGELASILYSFEPSQNF